MVIDISDTNSIPDTISIISIPDTNSENDFLAKLCFGTIVDAHVVPFQSSKASKYFETCNKTGISFFQFRYRVEGITMVATDLDEVGELESRYAQIFKSVKAEAPSLRCEAYVVEDLKTQEITTKLPKYFPIEINVYGNENEIERIGASLSKANLYLQEPDHLEKTVVYRNPHVYSLSNDLTTPLFRNLHPIDGLDFEQAMDAIIHGSVNLEPPPLFIQDSRLQSKLRSHQISALRFMSIREEESIRDENLTLWEPKFSHGMRCVFKHKVTGMKCQTRASECRGGLLSDEMGMGKSLSILALVVHSLKDAEGFKATHQHQPSKLSGRRRYKATLIITPKTTIQSWLLEVERHIVPGSVKVYVYHGQSKYRERLCAEDVDIVLTTYETVASDWKSPSSVFRQMELFRIVLDEAHTIRNSSTQCFQAVHELMAQRRWCLTGTPIQNNLGDLFSLTKFLRYYPFDQDSSIRKHIKDPLQKSDQKGLDNLRHMMKVFSLRRSKTLCGIPRRHERTVPVALAEAEQQLYQDIRKRTLSRYLEIAARDTSKSSHVILQGILRLRQICSHGSVSRWSEPDTEGLSNASMRCCDICQMVSGLDAQSSVGFNWQSCSKCGNALPTIEDGSLAMLEDTSLMNQSSEIYMQSGLDQVEDEEQSHQLSSKLNTVVGELIKLHQRSINDIEYPEKSLVFSSWKKTLAYLQTSLTGYGIKSVQINGEHSLERRVAAINTFQSDPNITVMLLTLGSGSVGLNLTAASHVHIVEPHWNPMVEEQAAARVHRIGQTKPVTIHRYIVEDSVEERIKNMQRRKIWYAELANADSSRKAGEKAMKDLEALL